MAAKGSERVLTVTIELDETSEETEAHAHVDIGDRHFGGWGRARRNPSDPDVPMIGEELATARALGDLAHRLVDAAVEAIEGREGRPADVHG